MAKETKEIDNIKNIIPAWARWLPALLIMGIIFALSSFSSTQLPNFDVFDLLVKKGGHFTGYALLGCAYLFALRKNSVSFPFLPALILVLLYAASDELHQSFVPGRHPSPVDIAIDLAGAITGLWIFRQIILHRKNSSR